MADVFLSYARVDQVAAKRVVCALEKENLTVWWDKHLLPVGDATFDSQIERQISESSEFDGPVWPHLDGHIWPHPTTTVCPISYSNWFLPPRRKWSLATPVGRRRLGVTDAGVAKTAPPGAPWFSASSSLPPFAGIGTILSQFQ